MRVARGFLLGMLLWIGCQPPAIAVPPGQVSKTAIYVCVYRAIAAQHPDPLLRNPDSLAGKLCSDVQFLPEDYASARSMIDTGGESYSGYFFVNARTLYIDAALRQAIADGATQVVVLGAGFDSRAYRFHDSHPAVRFFEVDLPATIESKKNRLVTIYGAVPDYVQYAPIDFDTQKLEDVLPALGYDPRQRTFFILEGVVMYVQAAGDAATLRFIRHHSARGSRVVYDYVLRRVVDGDYAGMYGAGVAATGVALAGEPFVTGWTPHEAAAFARRQGLQVIEDLGTEELTRRFLIGSDGKPDGRMIEGQRVLQAQVP